jgi:hypothetical protein
MGKPKSIQRIRLEKHNLIDLLKRQTMYEIASTFNTSYKTVNEVAQQQFNLLEINRFEETKEKIVFTGTKGAWAELKSTQLYKQIMYGRG